MAKLISTTTMILQNLFLVKNKGSKNLLCAHGWAGQTQLPFSWRRISQSEIRNSAAAKARAGREFLSPQPPFFPAPPERSGVLLKISPNFFVKAAPNKKLRFFSRPNPRFCQLDCGFLPNDMEVRADFLQEASLLF